MLVGILVFAGITGENMYIEIGRHRSIIANEDIRVSSSPYEKVKTFKYLGSLVINQNSTEKVTCRLKAGNSCYYSVQTLLSSRLLCKNLKIKICKNNNISSFAIWV